MRYLSQSRQSIDVSAIFSSVLFAILLKKKVQRYVFFLILYKISGFLLITCNSFK
jgi:hypothetical protein